MPMVLRSNWWAVVLRGVLAVLMAIITFALPGVTIAILVTIFGVYALMDGVFAIISTIKAVQGHRRWGAFLLEGVIGIVFGLYAIIFPIAAAAVFVTLLALWAIFTGIFEITAAIRLRQHMKGEWLLILVGVLSILLGLILFAAPVGGAVFVIYVLAGYGLIFGILLITLGLKICRFPQSAVYTSLPGRI